MLPGRSIDVGLAPRVVRYGAAFQIGTIPSRQSWGGLDKCSQTLGRGRVPSRVQVEQIERAREALNLDFGGFDFRFAQIVEHARADQRHDEADDGYDDQHFHEREATLAANTGASASCRADLRFRVFHFGACGFVIRRLHPTTWVMERSAVMTETMRPPTTTLMEMMASGPTTPTTRSRLRCSFAS